MQLGIFGKLFIVHHAEGTYLKFNVFPNSDIKKIMAIGTVAMEENEARRLYQAMKSYFEHLDFPEGVEVKDMRNMQRVSAEFRVRKDQANRAAPISAQAIQEQNFKAEGRMEKQMGDVAEIKKKKEGEYGIKVE
jgi:hypothetical protein